MSTKLLIADCGATSGKWAYIDRASGSVVRFRTGPVNASLHNTKCIAAEMARAIEQCPEPPAVMCIYAAGAVGEGKSVLAGAAMAVSGLPPEDISVSDDLTGAALALLGGRAGIACILGTGSNSCLWDGRKIMRHIPPMGYILGDEGSGAALGAALLRAALRGLLPDDLMADWESTYPGLDYAAVVDAVYRRHEGSGYIASYVPFIQKHIERPAMQRLVMEELGRFIDNVVSAYPESRDTEPCYTGGIASVFEKQLREVSAERGIGVGIIAPDPLDLLIRRAVDGD